MQIIVSVMDYNGKVREHLQCQKPVSNGLIEMAQYFGGKRWQCAQGAFQIRQKIWSEVKHLTVIRFYGVLLTASYSHLLWQSTQTEAG